MSKKPNYRQCLMRKKYTGGFYETTSFIPEPFCKVGKVLKLKNDAGEWSNGWEVVFAGDLVSEQKVDLYSRSHLKTRKYSDV